MSVDTLHIKRHNHRVHPCDRTQKLDLLKYLITLHSDKEILVIATQDISTLDEQIDADNVSFVHDAVLLESPKVKCDMIISLDLAATPENYAKRLNQTNSLALLLADEKDQQSLYKVETFLKRTLTKEIIDAFEPQAHKADREASADLKERQEYNRKNQEERDEKRKKAWAKQKKESKYLGKDEDGKPIFSGKSGERNHRFDGTPRSDDEKKENPRFKKKSYDSEKKPWDKNNSNSDDWRNKATNKDEKKPQTSTRAPRVIKIPAKDKSSK